MDDKEYFDYLIEGSPLKRVIRRIVYLRTHANAFGENDKVLDVGCGIGEFLALKKNSIGIDTNKHCIDHCRSRGCPCKLGNAYDIPFLARSFDGVLLDNVLEHLEKPEDVLKEIRRVLKRGARLVIEVPCEKGFRLDETHRTFWGKEKLVKLLEGNGFEVERAYYFPLPSAFNNIFSQNKVRVWARKK